MFRSWKQKRDPFEVRIDQNEKCFVSHRLAFEIHDVDRIAAQKHAETTHKRRRPFVVAHFAATRRKPHHIFDLASPNPATLEKFRTSKDRMIFAELNQATGKLKELTISAVPIEPTDLVVLAISV